MEQQNLSLEKYCIIGASSMSDVARRSIKGLVESYGSRVVDGWCVTQYGVSAVTFVQIEWKEGPIVDMMVSLAERYNLYPFYIMEENKGYLSKQAKFQHYIVEEATAVFSKNAAGIDRFKELVGQTCKKIYREEHVFVKMFMYEALDGYHAAMFNTERSPQSRDKIIGVPEWREAVCKFVSEMCGSVRFKTIRYANL